MLIACAPSNQHLRSKIAPDRSFVPRYRNLVCAFNDAPNRLISGGMVVRVSQVTCICLYVLAKALVIEYIANTGLNILSKDTPFSKSEAS